MRYAIYYLPPSDGALWRFGCSVIGYDSSSGRDIETFVPGFDMTPLTREPARYGFHATLKAPFRLRESVTQDDLVAAMIDFARQQAPVHLGSLAVNRIAGFIAMAPRSPQRRLNEFAALCVQTFDVFRASMSEDERQRRLNVPLSPRQQNYLDLWGYPYVLDEFRFHLTLTDSLSESLSEHLAQALSQLYAPIDAVHRIEQISLCAQSQPGERFREIARFTLGLGT